LKIRLVTLLLIVSFSRMISAQDDLRFELENIRFEGNNSIPGKVLLSIIKSKESPNKIFQFVNTFTSLGAPPVYFDLSLVPEDMENILLFYNSQGFFKTTVEYYYSLDSSSGVADLTYIVNEGSRANFGQITLHGLEKYPPQEFWKVNDRLTIKEGSPYTQDGVIYSVNNVLGLLKSEGYMLSNYDSTIVVKDTLADVAPVDISFTLGNKYYIDSLGVTLGGEGKSEVEPEMISDLTGLKWGELYDINRVTQAQVRLYRTGLFSYIRLYPAIEEIRDSLVPLKIDGNITKMNDLNPELVMNNIQNAFNFGVSIEYNRKNFFGGARRFTSKAQIYYQDIFSLNIERIFSLITLSDTVTTGAGEFKARIEQPYIFEKPILGSLEFSSLITKIEFLQVSTYKAKLNFEFELPKFTFVNNMSLFYALEYNKQTLINSRLGNPSNDLMSAGFGSLLFSTHVDDVIFPTTGANYSIYFEEGNFFPYLFSKIFTGDYRSLLFLKTQITGSYYFPLSGLNDLVLAMKYTGGYIATLSGDPENVPYVKEFFVGGSNSVRGWSSRAFPRQRIDSENYDNENIPGGRIMVEGSFELRKRMGELLGAALFLDWGNSWKDLTNVKLNELAVAAGFGFRFYTQIAAFRLDFGFKVYDPYDRTPLFQRRFFDLMQFHFGIGEAF